LDIPARDTKYDATSPLTLGKIHCKLWEDAAIELREKLVTEADATPAGFSVLVVVIATALVNEQQNDAVAKTMLTNALHSSLNNESITNNASGARLVNTAGSIIKGGLATGGVITASALFSVTMTAVLQSLPMVQAIMLLGIYALLPLVVVCPATPLP